MNVEKLLLILSFSDKKDMNETSLSEGNLL